MQYYSVLGIFFTLLGVVILFLTVKAPKPNILGYFGFFLIILGQLTLCVLGIVRIHKINEASNTVNNNETVVIEETMEDRLYIPDRGV